MHKSKAFGSNPEKRRCVQVSDSKSLLQEKNNSTKNGTPKQRLAAKRRRKYIEIDIKNIYLYRKNMS